MTVKTLSFIHSLLLKEVEKAELKKRWLWDAYVFAGDELEDHRIDRSEYEAKEQEYEAARKEYNTALSALHDFEAKEW